MENSKLSQAVIHQATVLSVFKGGKIYKIHELADMLKAPKGYSLSGRLRGMCRDGKIIQGKPYKSKTNNQITNTYLISDIGKEYLKENIEQVQIVGEYDLEKVFINKGIGKQKVKTQDMFSPQAAGLGALGEVINETTSMKSMLSNIRASLRVYVDIPEEDTEETE